jgi:hypothetical protein
MSENNAQSAPAKSLWEVLAHDEQVVTVEKPQETTPEQIQTKDTVAESETPELKVSTTEPEKPATETTPVTTETKPDETKASEAIVTEDDDLAIKPEDFRTSTEIFKEGTFQHLAQQFDIKLEKESPEDFIKVLKDNFVPKSEAEKLATAGKEKFFSTLKPEVAAMLELRDMLPHHIPDEVIFNPTGRMDWLLNLPDEQLVRQLMEDATNPDGSPRYDEETINTEMELLSQNPTHLTHKARMGRDGISEAKTNVLASRDNLIQTFKQKQEQAESNRKAERDEQFKKVLDKVPAFLTRKLSNEHKDLIWQKYKGGEYANVLDNPENMVNAVFLFEFGDSTAKLIASKAKAEGKAEIVQKLSDVPPKQATVGQVVQQQTNQTTNSADKNFGAIPNMFKD